MDIAARLLFGEIPAPPGNLPVSVPGVGYDLITATSPFPEQVIPLLLDYPSPTVEEGAPTPTPSPEPVFRIGDLIPVRTGIILDHNGNQVPDFTPVQFFLSGSGDSSLVTQNEVTQQGAAYTTFLVDRSGIIEIRVESEPATESTILRFDIPAENGQLPTPTATSSPTITPTATPPEPTLTATPEATPMPPPDEQTGVGDWVFALFVSLGFGAVIYWITTQYGLLVWGIRAGLLSVCGGLLAYTYLATGLPGSETVFTNIGSLGVLLITSIGSGIGWGASKAWQMISNRYRKNLSTQQSGK